MLADVSEARPLSAGSASTSIVKALTTRPPMHKEHKAAAEMMARTSLLIQEVVCSTGPLSRILSLIDAIEENAEDTIVLQQ